VGGFGVCVNYDCLRIFFFFFLSILVSLPRVRVATIKIKMRVFAQRSAFLGSRTLNDDVYSLMKAENTQLQETEWIEDRQTY